MSPAKRPAKTASGGDRQAGVGAVIAIPVPTTPAVIAVPGHERAWDVPGAWPAWARYAARQVPRTVVAAGFTGLAVLLAVETPMAETWPAFAAAAVVALVTSSGLRRALRARRALLRHRWTAYGGAVSRTESAAWIVLQQPRVRSNAHVVASMRVSGGRRTREEVATPAYEHVWFAGDPRRGGVVVPAGGGPLVFVNTFLGAKAPSLSERVSTAVMPVDAVRPTLVQWVLGKILSPATRRNMAARAQIRVYRRNEKAKAALATRAEARKERDRKQAEWARAHPEKARRQAERVQRESARRKAERDREAQRRQAEQARRQARAAKAGKSTVVTTLRARQQAKAMRDNFGKRG